MRFFIFLMSIGSVLASSEDYSNWMSRDSAFLAERTLRGIIIPGTHDSGTSSFNYHSDRSPDFQDVDNFFQKLNLPPMIVSFLNTLSKYPIAYVMALWAKTQGRTIKQQLEDGIRYFDLRVCFYQKKNLLYLAHGLFDDQSVNDILKDVHEFLMTHEKEIVILDFHHFSKDVTEELHEDLIQHLKMLKPLVIPADHRIDRRRLSDLWRENQRLLVLYDDFKTAQAHPDLLWLRHYHLQSLWPNTVDPKLLHDQATRYLMDASLNYLFASQLVLTPDSNTIKKGLINFAKPSWMRNGDPTSLRELAKTIIHQDRVLQWFKEWCPQKDKMNIVVIDWYHEFPYVQSLVEMNRRNSCD